MKTRKNARIILLALSLGCGKPDSAFDTEEKLIIGKWTYLEYFYSIGGPGEWHQVTPANQTIEFKPDGFFISTNSFLKEATHYEFVDSITIKFQPASTPSGYILMKYEINPTTGELYLHQADPACIEGCSSKFKRQVAQTN